MGLKVDSVTVSFGDKKVLREFSLAFPPSGFVGISGPSGCGKTTLLKTIAGLINPDEGSIAGLDNTTFSLVFAEDVLLDWLTVEENIQLVVPQGKAQVSELLEMVELPGYEKFYPADLSKGMKRRVAIARALAVESDVLLLDEPTANLDKRLAFAIMEKIVTLRKDKLTICVTHDIEILEQFATQTYRF